MKQLLSIAADRLARRDLSSADRADYLRTFGVVNTTVGTKHDVLSGLDTQAAERTGRQFGCHVVTSNDDRPPSSGYHPPKGRPKGARSAGSGYPGTASAPQPSSGQSRTPGATAVGRHQARRSPLSCEQADQPRGRVRPAPL